MDVCERLPGYHRVWLNSLIVAAYSALKLTSLMAVLIMVPRCAVKFRHRQLINLDGLPACLPSVFHRQRCCMIPAAGSGTIWCRRRP